MNGDPPQEPIPWVRVRADYGNGPRSGSGVVPDKPALAPEHGIGCWPPLCPDCGYALFMDEAHADCALLVTSVPAVTDDEAATLDPETVLREALLNGCLAGRLGLASREAQRLMAELRSAGFLIIHHTKET